MLLAQAELRAQLKHTQQSLGSELCHYKEQVSRGWWGSCLGRHDRLTGLGRRRACMHAWPVNEIAALLLHQISLPSMPPLLTAGRAAGSSGGRAAVPGGG
jgi:hypothetical protein